MTVSERIFRANAAVECEKVMSRHVYYHAACVHREEIDEFWSKRDDITWAHNFGQMGNRENYVSCYAGDSERDNWAIFEELKGIYPEVEDKELVPDWRALCEEAIHFTCSPIIEVAEDGLSAKGLFYTPGAIFSTLNPERAREGTWIWERYGADFVYEDGQWVYLNLKVCCDLAGGMDAPNWPLAGGFGPPPAAEDGAEGEDAPPPPGGHNVTHPGPLHFDLTETQLPQCRPFMPVPYRTFSESYPLSTLTGIYEQ